MNIQLDKKEANEVLAHRNFLGAMVIALALILTFTVPQGPIALVAFPVMFLSRLLIHTFYNP
jgi:hypothetical protein